MTEKAPRRSSTGTIVLDKRGMALLSNLEEEIVKTGDRELIDKWNRLGIDTAIRSSGNLIAVLGKHAMKVQEHRAPLRSRIRRYMLGEGESQKKRELARIINEFEKALDRTDQKLSYSIDAAKELNTKMLDLSQGIRLSIERGRKVLDG